MSRRRAVCGSNAIGHRGTKCRDCQRFYARAKRSKARAARPPRRPACGSSDPAHKAAGCAGCRVEYDARYHRSHARIRKRARDARREHAGRNDEKALRQRVLRVLRKRGVAPESCFSCGVRPASVVVEDADTGEEAIGGAEWLYACSAHRRAGKIALAKRVAEKIQDGDRASTRSQTVGEAWAQYAPAFRSLPKKKRAELEAAAAEHPFLPGEQLDRKSPLYLSRLAALTRRAVEPKKP